jgi:hypothetical protein
MKKIFAILFIATVAVSCNQNSSEEATVVDSTAAQVDTVAVDTLTVDTTQAQ